MRHPSKTLIQAIDRLTNAAHGLHIHLIATMTVAPRDKVSLIDDVMACLVETEDAPCPCAQCQRAYGNPGRTE